MIKEYPMLYLGKESLQLLRTYINGYIARQQEIDGNYNFCFYKGFQKYVEKLYKQNSILSWENIIDSHSSSEEIAFNEFYRILDIFIMEKPEEEKIEYKVTTWTCFKERLYKERHFTDHGNPNRFTNPHDHYFKWISNDIYYLGNAINYYDDIPNFIKSKN